MKRIAIVGTSGCGKTTLANKLSKMLSIPCIDLDDYYWLPGWQSRPIEEFQTIVGGLTKSECWIMSGNYSKAMQPIWERSDTVIWLDYGILQCLYRGFYRSIQRVIRKEPCCNGNYESFNRAFFSKHSILLWIISTFRRRKFTYGEAFDNKIGGKDYWRFTGPKETNAWLARQ